jgi:hypothetical protein
MGAMEAREGHAEVMDRGAEGGRGREGGGGSGSGRVFEGTHRLMRSGLPLAALGPAPSPSRSRGEPPQSSGSSWRAWGRRGRRRQGRDGCARGKRRSGVREANKAFDMFTGGMHLHQLQAEGFVGSPEFSAFHFLAFHSLARPYHQGLPLPPPHVCSAALL